jgi:hypothetical protein
MTSPSIHALKSHPPSYVISTTVPPHLPVRPQQRDGGVQQVVKVQRALLGHPLVVQVVAAVDSE